MKEKEVSEEICYYSVFLFRLGMLLTELSGHMILFPHEESKLDNETKS